MGDRTKFSRLTNTRTVPTVTPLPVRARNAPTRNTPSCTMSPATAENSSTRMDIFLRRSLAAESCLTFSAKMRHIRASAWKDLTTENPERLSRRVDI